MLVQLLTWNLGCNGNDKKAAKSFSSLELVCDYARGLQGKKKSFAVALQECPEDCEQIQKCLPGLHVGGGNRLMIISSHPLESTQLKARFFGAHIKFAEDRTLALICYHGIDKISLKNETARGGYSSEFRWLFDKFQSKTPYAVICGDFNAEPESHEIQHEWCFDFATKESPRTTSHDDRTRSSFHVIPYSKSVSSGTCVFRDKGMEQNLLSYDYFVATKTISHDIASFIERKLAGKSLVDRNGIPSMSDHLPVMASLNLP